MTSFDFNLLPQLQALLRYKNVTRAAEHLALSQPATSAALGRLRKYFDDELLVRSGRIYVLTPLAQDLVHLVDNAVLQSGLVATARSRFEPESSERKFVLAASDYAASLLVAPLRRILSTEAPHVTVDVVPTPPILLETSIHEWDLIIGPMGYDFPGQRKQIFRDSFVAIVDEMNPVLVKEDITLNDLAFLPQAVGVFGPGIKTPVDLMWEEQRKTTRNVAQVSGLLALSLLIEGTDLMAMVPRMLAHRMCGNTSLNMIEFPVEIEPVLVEAMFWHTGRAEDPANIWLRSVVQRACAGLHHLIDGSPVTRTISINGTNTI